MLENLIKPTENDVYQKPKTRCENPYENLCQIDNFVFVATSHASSYSILHMFCKLFWYCTQSYIIIITEKKIHFGTFIAKMAKNRDSCHFARGSYDSAQFAYLDI